jgi:hypothetical protein
MDFSFSLSGNIKQSEMLVEIRTTSSPSGDRGREENEAVSSNFIFVQIPRDSNQSSSSDKDMSLPVTSPSSVPSEDRTSAAMARLEDLHALSKSNTWSRDEDMFLFLCRLLGSKTAINIARSFEMEFERPLKAIINVLESGHDGQGRQSQITRSPQTAVHDSAAPARELGGRRQVRRRSLPGDGEVDHVNPTGDSVADAVEDTSITRP